MIDHFAVAQMTAVTEPSFHETGVALYESLPPQVRKTWDAITALDNLARASEDITKNRLLSNALELTLMLSKITWAKNNATAMWSARKHEKEYNTVRDMWWLKVTLHAEKCHKAKCLDKYLKGYCALSDAIKSWNFDAVPWVMIEKDAARDKLCKEVMEVLSQIEVASNTMDRIGREMEVFAEKGECKEVASALAVCKVAELQVRPCRVLVAEMIMCGMFVVGEKAGKSLEAIRAAPEYKPAVAYIKNGLKVNIEELDKQLKDRILGKIDAAASSSAPGSSAGVGCDPAASPGSTPGPTDEAPKKKRARLGGGGN